MRIGRINNEETPIHSKQIFFYSELTVNFCNARNARIQHTLLMNDYDNHETSFFVSLLNNLLQSKWI